MKNSTITHRLPNIADFSLPKLPRLDSSVFMALAAAFLFSSKGVVIKLLYSVENPLEAGEILVWRMIFSAPFFFAFALHSAVKKGLPEGIDFGKIVFFGVICYYFASITDFMGLQYISAGTERMVLYLYPFLVVLIGAVTRKKAPPLGVYAAFAICYSGMVAIFSADLDMDRENGLRGILLVGCSATIFAIYLIGSAHVIRKVGSMTFTSIAMSAASVVIVGSWFAHNKVFPPLPEGSVNLLLILSVLGTVVPVFLMNHAIGKLGSDKMAVIGSLGPVMTLALGFVVLKETVDFTEAAGIAAILYGVYCLQKVQKKESGETAS